VNVARTEQIEGELDAFIVKRDKERRQNEGERAREQLWVESVRRYHARQEDDHRAAWCDYERRMRDLHWSLGDEHDRKLKKLENGHHKESA
jgi:predicted acetyltransferase